MHSLAEYWISRLELHRWRLPTKENVAPVDPEPNMAPIVRVHANRAWHTCELARSELGERRYCDGNGLLLVERDDSSWSYWRGSEIHRLDGPAVRTHDGIYRWMLYGCTADTGDAPNVVSERGLVEWRDHITGSLHAFKQPAQIRPDGSEYWYRYGVLHRDDGPAVTTADNSRKWYTMGRLLRTEHADGLMIEYDEHGDIRRIRHAH